jgi:hypothetical protein
MIWLIVAGGIVLVGCIIYAGVKASEAAAQQRRASYYEAEMYKSDAKADAANSKARETAGAAYKDLIDTMSAEISDLRAKATKRVKEVIQPPPVIDAEFG